MSSVTDKSFNARNVSPLVSIVTSCYNGSSHLEKYFEGLIAQTYKNIEFIFVNDGSRDNTERIFSEYKPIIKARFDGTVKYIYQENKGVCAAMNAGYQAVSGQYIAPCDSDDVMLSGKIEAHVAAFEQNPDCDLVYGKYIVCDETMQPIRYLPKWENPPSGNEVYNALLVHGMFIMAGSYCFRKECLQLLPGGKLNESYTGQNLELLLRVGYSRKIAYHPDPTVCIIERKSSLSHKASLNALITGRYKIQMDITAELGCSKQLKHIVEADYIQALMLYSFISRDKKGVRECFIKGLKLHIRYKRIYLLFLLHLMPRIWNWVIRKRYSKYIR